jgi:hypothetical protein
VLGQYLEKEVEGKAVVKQVNLLSRKVTVEDSGEC